MGAVAGSAAGLVGAAAWAMVAYFMHLEIGWLAWGVGAAVGVTTAAGASAGGSGGSNDAASGPLLGLLAALITMASLCAGKYAVVEIGLQQSIADYRASLGGSEPLDDETLTAYLADEIGEQAHGENWWEQYKWPEGVDVRTASSETEYPRDLWRNAATEWRAMSEEQRAAYRQQTQAEIAANLEAVIADVAAEERQEGFFGSFGGMDLLFFGLGIVTAWQIASSGGEA